MLGPPPPEPRRDADPTHLAPWFAAKLTRVIDRANVQLAVHSYLFRFALFEGWRSNERQQWLYGSSRTYRGRWLTNAQSCFKSWHGFGLASDVVPRVLLADGSLGDFTWDVPAGVWAILYDAAVAEGCTTGLHWHSVDEDHVQPDNVKTTPSPAALAYYHTGGLAEVWRVCQPST